VDEIHFADGIDTPERLVLGLQTAQLVVAVCGVLLGYAVSRLPLAAGVRLPAAASIAALAAGVAWARVGGRPALDWAVFWARFLLRRRDGSLLLVPAAPPAALPAVLEPTGGSVLALPLPASRRSCARRVCFFSFKGGVGRTTLATETAAWLAVRQQQRVALLDLNTSSPGVGIRLGLPEPTLEDVHRTGGALRVLHSSGVQVLPWLQSAAASDGDGAWTARLLESLDVDRFDVVVADLGPCLSAASTAYLRRAHDVFVVVVPTAGGVRDAYRCAAALRGMGIRDSLRVVLNRASADADISEPIADLRIPLVATVPEHQCFAIAEHDRCVASLTSDGIAAGAAQRIAQRLLPVEA